MSISIFGSNSPKDDLSVEQILGKTIVWAHANPFGQENSPTETHSIYGEYYVNSIYNGLMRRTIASDRAFVPNLAAAMPVVSIDGKQWTFTLRPGLKFSDGSDLNASSIVFSYQVHLTSSIDSEAGSLALYFSKASIVEIDNLTVQFNMLIPYAFAANLFSKLIYSENHFGPLYSACLADVTLAACDWNDNSGINLQGGSGPFMVDKYDTINNFIEMVPNPFYYNAAQIKIDRIVIRTIVDATAAKVAFASGETNVFDSQYRAKASDFSSLVGITDVFVGAPGIQELAPNHNHPYFGLGTYSTTGANARTDFSIGANQTAARNIRKAMSHMINRVFIANEITGGLSSPAATIMPSISIGWDETLLPRIYSQDVSKAYMEDAGFDYTGKTFDPSTGAMDVPFFSITVLSPLGNADRELWAAIMVQELPKIGIGVLAHETGGMGTVVFPRTFTYPGPPPTYENGGYDIFFLGWSFGLDFNPVGLYEFEFQNPSCCNVYNYNNATVENAIAAYVSELDAALRISLIRYVQQLLYDDQPSLAIILTTEHWAWASNILGLDGLSMSQRTFEWELVDITGVTSTNTDTVIITSVSTITSTSTITGITTNTESSTTLDPIQTSETIISTTHETTTKIDFTTSTEVITPTETLTNTISVPISMIGLLGGMIFIMTITLSYTGKSNKRES